MTEEQAIRDRLSDRWWRLNNLYWIKDKQGRRVKFQPNWAQKHLYNNLWYLNLILKARQLGMTTFIQIFMLDACLFNKNQSAGVIAHNREDAEEFFSQKIKYAYDNLPDWLKAEIPNTSDSAKKLAFSNGSSIRVGTSLRSGTLQYLHISEFGKICAKYPEKAEEIISGSLNTVEAGCFVFIESTAEGAWGRFYDMCMEARGKAVDKLSKLDYRFFFFPWWRDPSYSMDETVEDPDTTSYLDYLSETSEIELTEGQRNWYSAKKRTQRGKMKQEYPSTPEEAFERVAEYAVYGAEMRAAHEDGRIGRLPYEIGYPVHTFWDLGRSKTDQTCIWFMQFVKGEYLFIDYYQNAQRDIAHYVQVMQSKGYVYGTDHLPHDGGHNDFNMTDYASHLRKLGRSNVVVVDRIPDLNLGIQATREMFPKCRFDSEKCTDGLAALGAYRFGYDEKKATLVAPVHDWASHPSDAFRQAAQGFKGRSNTIQPHMSERRREAIRRNQTKSGASWIV